MKTLPPLSPHRRQVLLDSLRPPSGFHLDAAVGTCFSLDLMSALLVPMAFAMFDTEDGDDHADPVALLAATQAYASNVTLYCEQGRIAPAAKAPKVVAYLERSLKPVAPPKAGCFHPKLWVLRYRANRDGSTRHRVLCLSRNLTFDRSWDSILRLEEGPAQPGQVEPLQEFLRYLNKLAPSAEARSIADSIAGVSFEAPKEFDRVSFAPLLPGNSDDPIGAGDDLLVISPFLGPGRLKHFTDNWSNVTLASRGESLDRIAEPSTIDAFRRIYVFDTLEAEEPCLAPSDEGLAESVALSGLHAKLYAGRTGSSSFLLVGSANAGDAAFKRNVEFCVRLESDKLTTAPRKLLESRPDKAGLSALLRDYEPPDQPSEKTQVELELERLETLLRDVAGLDLTVRCKELRDGSFAMTLHSETRLPPLEPGDRLRCWPISLTEGRAEIPSGAPLARWAVQSIVHVTSLIAFELAGARGVPPLRFTLKAELEGDVEDRLDAILSDTLDDPRRLMQFLLLLLAAGGDDQVLALGSGRGDSGSRSPLGTESEIEIPLLETLMRTYAREPGRLHAFQRTLARLEAARKRGHALPEDLLEIWRPVENALGDASPSGATQ